MNAAYALMLDELAQEVPDGALVPLGRRRAREALNRHLADLVPPAARVGGPMAGGEPLSAWGLTPDELAARQADRSLTRQPED